MKFQKLIIHNIASIEDATIDFTAEPLRSSEVYLITGDTGAGKSIILDSICLSLFADTPRLDSTRMQGESEDELKVNDPRQLMRLNTGEAYTALTFVGNNGVSYEAVWSVARARKKPGGKLQSKSWILKNIGTGISFAKDAEIKAEITKALGVDFPQFCRTTMLAQGDFARFLNSKDDEKAEILEKVSGMDIYSRIGSMIYRMTDDKKKAYEAAERKVGGITLLSAEEIDEKKAEISVMNAESEALKNDLEQSTNKATWIERKAEFSHKLTLAQEELSKAIEEIRQASFIEGETMVKEWNGTIEVRAYLSKRNEAQSAIDTLEKKLKSLSDTYTHLSGEQEFASKEKENVRTKLEDKKAWLKSMEEKSSVYGSAQALLSSLNSISLSRKFISHKEEEILTETKTLNEELTPSLDAAVSALKDATCRYDNKALEVKSKEKDLEELGLKRLRANYSSAKDQIARLDKAIERCKTYTNVCNDIEKRKAALDETFKALEEKQKKSREMLPEVEKSDKELKELQDSARKLKDSVDKFAKTMRAELKEGDVCPVCRQKIISSLPNEDELALAYKVLSDQVNIAENKLKKLSSEKNILDAEILSLNSSYTREKKLLDSDQSVKRANDNALEALRECGCQDPNLLGQMKAESKSRCDELEGMIKEGEKKEQDLKDLEKALTILRTEKEKRQESKAAAEKAVNECNGRIGIARSLITSKQADISTEEETIKSILGEDSTIWKEDWRKAPEGFAAELSEEVKIYNEAIKARDELSAKLTHAENYLLTIQGPMDSILKSMPSWKELPSHTSTRLRDIRQEASVLSTDLSTTLYQLNTETNTAKDNAEKLKIFLEENTALSETRLEELNAISPSVIEKIQTTINQGHSNVTAKQTLLGSIEAMIRELERKKPEFDEQDSIESLKERIDKLQDKQRELGERKGGVELLLKQDEDHRASLGTLRIEADQKKAEYESWDQLNSFLGDQKGAKFRKIAQSYVLSSLIHSANAYMKTLSDRYTLKVTPGTFVISTEDAYQGYASRPTSTISGGETFLVSLALALALSDIGQQLSADTLFIDEGFGSLNGEPLQNAINTLRSLHRKLGRHVGIISHVKEVQETIPVQIRVTRVGTSSTSQVEIISAL